MTDKVIAYAQSLRRLARSVPPRQGEMVFTLPPATVVYLSDFIERGAMRSRYVTETMAETDRLRDQAETEMLEARALNESADALLERAERLRRWYLAGAVVTIGAALLLGGLIGVGLAWRG